MASSLILALALLTVLPNVNRDLAVWAADLPKARRLKARLTGSAMRHEKRRRGQVKYQSEDSMVYSTWPALYE